jgi:leader peptidase (prepilin peptidase)/N-methyltransferase
MSAIEIIAAGLLILLLVPITLFDLRMRRIPNSLNVMLAATGLGFRLLTAPGWQAMLGSLLAPIAIIAMFLTLIGVMKLLRRRGTLGLGDVKFLAAASIWVGFVGTTLVFVFASLLALLFTLARAPWRRLDFKAAIPFGPFLAISLALIFLTSASL